MGSRAVAVINPGIDVDKPGAGQIFVGKGLLLTARKILNLISDVLKIGVKTPVPPHFHSVRFNRFSVGDKGAAGVTGGRHGWIRVGRSGGAGR